MLRYFAVHNYRTIYGIEDDTPTLEFSTEVDPALIGDDTSLPRVGDTDLVPVSVIYGANAAGKSAIVDALATLQRIVVHRRQTFEPVAVEPHRLLGVDEPTQFTISVTAPTSTANDMTLTYDLHIHRGRIVYESLAREIDGREDTLRDEVIFTRSTNSRTLSTPHEAAQACLDLTLDNETAVAQLVARTPGSVPEADAFVRWMRDVLCVISGASPVVSFPGGIDPVEQMRRVLDEEMLPPRDTGIVDVATIEYPGDAEGECSAAVTSTGHSVVSDRAGVIVVASPDPTSGAALRAVRVVHEVDGRRVSASTQSESEGTRRALTLLPVIAAGASQPGGRVVVVDEVDRSLHANLWKRVVERVLAEVDADSRHQLIVTAHDVSMLRGSLLRPDEVWFVEKTSGGASDLVRASDFDDAHTLTGTQIMGMYLAGQFGAVPR